MIEGSDSNQPDVSSEIEGRYSYQDVADNVGAMLAYWDQDLVCRFANRSYQDWFGRCPREMVGRITLPELLGPELFEKNRPFVEAALAGKTQVFEREIVHPQGQVKYALATYYPHFAGHTVLGFFVHVADITSVKLKQDQARILEREHRRDALRSVIETRERELEAVAAELRDNISQTLAYCKMMLQGEHSREPENAFYNQVANYIHLAIHQLNALSSGLSPSIVHHFGLCEGLQDFVIQFQQQHNRQIQFSCGTPELELLGIADKISLFRIVQDYLHLVVRDPRSRQVFVGIEYQQGRISMLLRHKRAEAMLSRQSREFADIRNRIEYYEGALTETLQEGEAVLRLDFAITPLASR